MEEVMEEREKKLFEAISDDSIYDFIAKNYFDYSKEELKDVCLEFIYAFYELQQERDYPLSSCLDDIRINVEERFGYFRVEEVR